MIYETTTMHIISAVQIEGDMLIVLSGEKTYKWRIDEVSKKLSHATESERNNFEISPSGYGIHWPQIDEDLSLIGLLHTKH